MWRLALVLLLASAAAGCEQIRPPGEEKRPLDRVVMPSNGEIPQEFGQFVTATTTTAFPGWCQLYFEDERTGAIRIVWVDFSQRQLEPKVMVIPRGDGLARPEGS